MTQARRLKLGLSFYPSGYPSQYAPLGYVEPAPDLSEGAAVPFAPSRRECGSRVYHVPAEQGGERAITVTRC